jgi:hypothetical protein
VEIAEEGKPKWGKHGDLDMRKRSNGFGREGFQVSVPSPMKSNSSTISDSQPNPSHPDNLNAGKTSMSEHLNLEWVDHLIPLAIVAMMTYHDHRRFGHWRKHLFINLVLVTVAYFVIYATLKFIR